MMIYQQDELIEILIAYVTVVVGNGPPDTCCRKRVQAKVERELYMEIPKGVRLQGAKNNKDYVLQLVRNLYKQKQAGHAW